MDKLPHALAVANTHLKDKKRGQALLEYLLLIVILSSVTFAFSNFIVDSVFVPGLSELPTKMTSCLSTTGGASGVCD